MPPRIWSKAKGQGYVARNARVLLHADDWAKLEALAERERRPVWQQLGYLLEVALRGEPTEMSAAPAWWTESQGTLR